MSEPDLGSVERTFNEWARDGRGGGMEDDHHDVVLQMLDRAELEPQHHVLDLGCGTGWTVRLLAGRCPRGRAAGVDVAADMIEEARRTAHPANAEFTQAGAGALPHPEASFDRVVSMESVYYWPDLEAGFREVHRVLRPGGRFLAALEYFQENPHTANWGCIMGLDLHHLGARDYRALLERCGFVAARSELVRDRRPPPSREEYRPDPCLPDYDEFLKYREVGALLLEGRRP